ncbi:MAG: TOBE domain-containing protein, partial [Proteobacteria bacterium]|nr:TOBE domain-containing protein [Pseudomonadota bacterium]
GQILIARLTQKSFSELDLKTGKKVFAQVKSVALVA